MEKQVDNTQEQRIGREERINYTVTENGKYVGHSVNMPLIVQADSFEQMKNGIRELSKHFSGYLETVIADDLFKYVEEKSLVRAESMTKEEVLDKYYKPGMHWKSVNRENVLKALQEYADLRCKPLIKALEVVASGQQGELKGEFIVRIKHLVKTALQDYKK